MIIYNTLNSKKYSKHLIFLHIPKTAGQSLQKIIERQYDKRLIFTIGINTQKDLDKFSNFPEKKRENVRVIQGHMPFGIHEIMPQPCTYVTLVRDPIERIISSYYYVLKTPIHYLHEYVISKQMSLKDFVSSGISTDLDNGQTRRLSGVSAGRLRGSKIINFGDCSPSLLEKAKENICTYFSVVGISERFDESLLMMKQNLGWNYCFYIKKNVTHNRPSMQAINKDIIEIIQNYNKLDVELYKFCQSLFEKNMAKQGIKFTIKLEIFRRFNGFYGQSANLICLSKSGIMRLKSSAKEMIISK